MFSTALALSLSACTQEAASTSAAPPAEPVPQVDIDAEAQQAADAIDASNADAELERLKSELEAE